MIKPFCIAISSYRPKRANYVLYIMHTT